MEQNINYIAIMIDSLNKKVNILDEILQINKEQSELIVDIKKNMAEYDVTLDKKDKLIEKLNILDDGFQKIYDRIQSEIKNNSSKYPEEIKEMKRLIALITDKSVEIQQGEEKNRQVISAQFAKVRQEVKAFRDNKKVAYKYSTNMQRTEYVPSQFLDKKK